MLSVESFIPEIYDCAVNPELWPSMLAKLSDFFHGAYALIGFADFSTYTGVGPPPDLASRMIQLHSPWDAGAMRMARDIFAEIPGVENYVKLQADQSWSQMDVLPEAEFRKTDVYEKFCQPQGLRDCLNLNIIKRPSIVAGLALARRENAELFSTADKEMIEAISPHLRRALLINDITDKGRLALTLYHKLLDQLNSAVFLIGEGGYIEFANEQAQIMLGGGNILLSSRRRLVAARMGLNQTQLESAIARAINGERELGLAGIGVPIIGLDGTRAAAYVLPLGKSEIRNALGKGHCAIFVAQRGEQLPVTTEIMRTLFDLTPTEARVSTLLSEGSKPVEISHALGISINTIRTHLSHVFAKTSTRDQSTLTVLVRSLAPPLTMMRKES